MDTPNAWLSAPLHTKIIFLLAVFFVFVGIQAGVDVVDMGRQPPLKFALVAILSGLFSVVYAATGIRLRGEFWKVFIPLFAVHLLFLVALGHLLPTPPGLDQLNAAETNGLRNRLAFDGNTVTVCICLGYLGFLYVSISEARRYVRTETQKASLESEMAAAREIQRITVPDALPAVTGYAIESVYRPAAEVGGDFFAVISLKSGRTLVVIGDVSGKGLRAAMIVSMIVGMLRTVSDFTEEPAEILAELNRRLCGQTQGAFATCLVVRLADEGRAVLANAGHLPLYLNGSEVEIPAALPLGLVESAAYAEATLDMQTGDRVVLLTDGIPEARDQPGVLLGFSRVESLLRDGISAAHLAEVAQQHGQNDDITLLSIARKE